MGAAVWCVASAEEYCSIAAQTSREGVPGVGKFTKIAARLCRFKLMGLIFHVCWPEAVLR